MTTKPDATMLEFEHSASGVKRDMQDRLEEIISVKDFGAIADAQSIATGAISATDKTLTIGSALFAAGDVGKAVAVTGAGVAGAMLSTTIASFTSTTEVELTIAASTTVSGALVAWGTDDTAAITAARTATDIANGNRILHVTSGKYLFNDVLYNVESDSLWFNDGWASGTNVLNEVTTKSILITAQTSAEAVYDFALTKVGMGITAIAKGGQAAVGFRANMQNSSDGSLGNVAIYGRLNSDSMSVIGIATHGETRHAGSGTSIAISSENASYGTGGTMYGLVINNTTNGAETLHPVTGGAKAKCTNAFGIYVTGSTDDTSKWANGMLIGSTSIRTDGTAIKNAAPAKYGVHFAATAINSTADMFFEADSQNGIVFNNTYTTGNAIRMNQGQAVAFEAAGNVKIKYDGTVLGLYSGGTERFAVNMSTGVPSTNGTDGVSGGFTAQTGEVVTVTNGIITAIV